MASSTNTFHEDPSVVGFENPLMAEWRAEDYEHSYASDLEQEERSQVDPWRLPQDDVHYIVKGSGGLKAWARRHPVRTAVLAVFVATGLFFSVFGPLYWGPKETVVEETVVVEEKVVEKPVKCTTCGWIGVATGVYCLTNLASAVITCREQGLSPAEFFLSWQDSFLTCNYTCGGGLSYCCGCNRGLCCGGIGATSAFPLWRLATCTFQNTKHASYCCYGGCE